MANQKPIYMYDLDGNLVQYFNTTQDCANYFDKIDRDYINHNLKYCKKIRKDGKWYIISREKKDDNDKRQDKTK